MFRAPLKSVTRTVDQLIFVKPSIDLRQLRLDLTSPAKQQIWIACLFR